MKCILAALITGIIVMAAPASADSAWWFGMFKPSGDAGGKVTGELDLSPDYIFFIFGQDVGVRWQNLACDANACLFKILEPKPLALKNGQNVCAGGEPVAYVNVLRKGEKNVEVSLQSSLAPGSACLTGTYKPKFG